MRSTSSLLKIIIAVSVIIPIAVALLIFSPLKLQLLSPEFIGYLPSFHAIINSLTALVLIMALVAIMKKQIGLHRNLMTLAFVLGSLFLLSYITYHASASSTIFGDINHDGELDMAEAIEVGNWRGIYLFVLLSHILLSIGVVPLVLLAFYFALTDQIARHRKLVKWTFPIWLYVSITGVIVYLMISPYYI